MSSTGRLADLDAILRPKPRAAAPDVSIEPAPTPARPGLDPGALDSALAETQVDDAIQTRCQRCGTLMALVDPGPEQAWQPNQYWVCLHCGRHFWTTYPKPKTGYVVVGPFGTQAMHATSPDQ